MSAVSSDSSSLPLTLKKNGLCYIMWKWVKLKWLWNRFGHFNVSTKKLEVENLQVILTKQFTSSQL